MSEHEHTWDLLSRSGLLTQEELEKVAEAYRTAPESSWERAVRTASLPPDRLADTLEVIVSAEPRALSDATGTPEARGRYRRLLSLGEGGMGRVDLVDDTHLHRRVARKELLSGDPSIVARFLREARITAQLDHPGIVPIHELGVRADGTVYYTMKRVRGTTLREKLNECASLPDRLALLVHYADLCQAVGFAHSKGVIHRDLKPENVMVGPFGETLVLDWGLATLLGEPEQPGSGSAVELGDDARLTRAGSLLGTPSYMSPELASGRVRSADARSPHHPHRHHASPAARSRDGDPAEGRGVGDGRIHVVRAPGHRRRALQPRLPHPAGSGGARLLPDPTRLPVSMLHRHRARSPRGDHRQGRWQLPARVRAVTLLGAVPPHPGSPTPAFP